MPMLLLHGAFLRLTRVGRRRSIALTVAVLVIVLMALQRAGTCICMLHAHL
jgi:hypothetical protein